MDTAILVMIILCIIYVPIWVWVWRCPEKAAKYHLVKYGPTIMIKTRLGIKSMDKLGKYRRFWRVFGFISRLISVFLFLMMMYMLISAILSLPSRIGQGGIGIQYALAIPGFNPMLPLTYGIIALFVAMVVHEMGHGIQSRANDCDVDSTGLLYGVVPLGAFCEPNEEQLSKMSRRPQMDIYSAGISVNTIVAVISMALMLVLCSGITPAQFEQEDAANLPGVYYIDENSPGFNSGIPTSALVTGIKEYGETSYHPVKAVVSAAISFESDIEISPMKHYQLQYLLEDRQYHESEPLQMGALIKTVTNNSPAAKAELSALSYLYSITITRGSSEPVEHLISNSSDFRDLMLDTLPGDLTVVKTATITAVDGDVVIEEHPQVTLTTGSSGYGYLGVAVTDSGLTFTTPTVMLNQATNPLYGMTSPLEFADKFLRYLSGPINGLDPIPSSITWWYDAPGDDLTWKTVKMLYWLFWLDILLAISNALPAYPFDGGFLFEGGINWLLERLGIKDAERRAKMSGSISSSISTVTLVMFFLVLLAFII
jgi:membrane-associated protease RseP (regulator of RpoE activity)